jgi:hypothetical protein
MDPFRLIHIKCFEMVPKLDSDWACLIHRFTNDSIECWIQDSLQKV